MPPFQCRPRRRGGFTLIETALALAIVAFALIPVVGLLPIGLQVSRNASDLTFSSQIAQRLSGMIQQDDVTDAALLQGGNSTLEQSYYYFDSEGQPVSVGTAGVLAAQGTTVPASAVYSACILREVPSPTTPSLADATAGTLILQIVNDPSHRLSGVPALQSGAILFPVYLAQN